MEPDVWELQSSNGSITEERKWSMESEMCYTIKLASFLSREKKNLTR